MMNSNGPPPYPAGSMGRGYEFNPVTTSSSDFATTPLSHLNDSQPPLDPLNAMEKSLDEQV